MMLLRTSETTRRALRKPSAMLATAFLVALVLIAVAAPWLAPVDPNRQDLLQRLQGPGSGHWLGTDSLGRDNLSRLISGTRLTLLAVVQAVGIAAVVGIPLGLLAGLLGRWVDAALSWLADVLMSLPGLFLALAVIGILGPGLTNAMVALGIIFIPGFFRVARSSATAVRNETYIEAARSLGLSTWQILLRHALPNSSGPLLVQITFTLGLTVIGEASLSFLGLGATPPAATWGGMLGDAFRNIYTGSFQLLAPSLMIALTILSTAVLGDALRDALSRQHRSNR